MNGLTRRLFGLTVLATLSLVITTIFPGGFSNRPVGAMAYAANQGPILASGQTWPDSGPTAEDPAEIAAVISADANKEAKSNKGKGHGRSGSKSTTTTGAPGTTAASGSTASTAGAVGSSTTTTQTTTSSTSPGGETVSSGTITGNACPCEVTGTVELKGHITLQGDLVIMGGTLIARPGVDLDGNGFQIMFMNGGTADFQGTPVFTWSGNGSNANLDRDINFRDVRRIMFHHGAGPSVLKYFTVSNSGTGALGDYSIHFHMNGNTTRGTIVEGVVVVGSKNHAFVPHASHGITFRDTIAKDGRCDAYWWDPPEFQSTSQINNSNDIVYDHVLADGVTNCIGDDRGFRLSAFTLGAGNRNTIKNSVARNVRPSHPKDCSGFFWPELSDKQPSSWTFSNNASYGSSCNGIFVWQNDNEEHIVNGFKGDGIDHGAYLNRYDYRNVNVDFIEVHALGWTVTSGHVGTVTISRHTLKGGPVVFAGVTIERLVMDNGSNGGTLAGEYIFTDSGLTCADIEYRTVVANTRILLDGVSCRS